MPVSVGLLAALAVTQSTPPAAPAPIPCSRPAFRQLDFWVGDWEAADGPALTNRITRDEFGACAIVEHFNQPGAGPNGGDYIGGSYSMFDPLTQRWRQMWVDNNGGSFHFVGGPVEGQAHSFEFVTTEPIGPGTPALSRMIFEDVQADAFRWRWQRQNPDGTWTDNWVINYRRRAAN